MPLAVRVLPSGGSHVSVAIDDGDGDEDKEQGGEGAHLANQYCVIYVEIRRWLRASGFGLRASGFGLRASGFGSNIFVREEKRVRKILEEAKPLLVWPRLGRRAIQDSSCCS